MYLFTTPSSPSETPAPTGRAGAVVSAIRDGAQATGAGFDYLLATARRESALDPGAKAATSSATGLFQFIEQTWLDVMKNAGPKLGLSGYADAITARSDGSYTVDDPAARQAILDLRRDPKVSATLAGALTQRNGEALAGVLGREPTPGDLYAAHVLGAKGAANLIQAAQGAPARAAALDMPEAAAANRGLFYDRAGRARTTAELYASFSAAAAGRSPAATDVTALTQATPAAAGGTQTAAAFGGGGDLRSLFQTDARRGAVSDGVARLWQARAVAPETRPGPSWFPRSDPAADTSAAAPDPATDAAAVTATPVATGTEGAASGTANTSPATAASQGTALLNPPLPPRRPAGLVAARPSSSTLFATRSGP